MKKSLRILWMLVLCFAMVVAVACLSACSILLDVIEDEETSSGTSDGGSTDGSSSSVSGTYQIDLSVYDEDWVDKVVDSTMWTVTSSYGVYAYDTLVLNSDGTYALTKEMGADEVAIAHWSMFDGDIHFSTYTYYGTYTVASDGVTVTLSEVTSIAYEVDVFETSLSQNVGTVIEYTETTNLESDAGTLTGETVIDLYYGFYLVNSGYGNCSQVVTLGTYDYGSFTFSGLATGDDGSGDSGGSGSTLTIPDGGYTFTSGTSSDIVFNVYADGTYVFAWLDYSVMEEGTYTWDRLTQTLTITDPAGTETVATVSDDTISFTYYYSVNSALTQDYSGSIAEMEEIICEVIFELIPTADASVTLKLYSDGTYSYTDGTNSVTETGTYGWSSPLTKLTLTLPDGTEIESTISGNLMTVAYVSSENAQSSQSFVCSLSNITSVMPKAEAVYAFNSTNVSDNNYMDFTLYDDGTYIISYYLFGYSGEMEGGWTFDGETLAVTLEDGTEVPVTIEEDVISVNYDNGFTQVFEGSLAALRAATGYYTSSDSAEVIYSFDSTNVSSTNSMALDLYDDGTYTMSYTLFGYSGSESGWYAWYTESDTLVLVLPDYSAVTAEVYIYEDGDENDYVSGDTVLIKYVSPASSSLSQTFAGSLTGLIAVFERAEVYSFSPTSVTEGNTMTFILYDDYSWEIEYQLFGYTGTVDGTWSYAYGELEITSSTDEVSADVSVDGDVISIYVSGFGQTFTGSAAALAKAVDGSSLVQAVYELSPTSLTDGNAMTFTLYDDNTWVIEYLLFNYAGTVDGTWTYEDGELIIPSTDSAEVTVTTDGDTLSVYVNAGFTQTFTGSVTELAAAVDSSAMAKAVYELSPTNLSDGNAMTFTLYDDNTWVLEYLLFTYEGTVDGTWSYEDGELTISSDSTNEITVSIDGDDISVYIDAGFTQTFTGSVSELEAALPAVIYSFESTNVSSTNSMALDLYDDGTYTMSYTLFGYSGSESGWYVWYEDTQTLVIVLSDYTVITAYADETDTDVIYVNYVSPASSALSQIFKGSLSSLTSALGN